MPYAIRETDDCDYEVYNQDTDEAVGCAGSKAKAEAMIRALDAADAEGDGGGDGKGLDGSGPAEDIKCIPFEIKAATSGTGPNDPPGFSGLGAAYHNLDLTGDIIAPGAFKDSLDRFLSIGVIGGLNHDWNNPIGHPVEARETPEGLYLKAVLDDSDDARNALAKMKINPASGRATIRRLSIGYKARDAQPLGPDEVRGYWAAHGYAPDALEVKALQSRKGARLLKRVDLYEISPVTVPANDRAVILAAKCGMGMPYGPGPGGGSLTLDDATDRVRDSIVGILLDYLMMSARVTVANDMVSPNDRLTILGQVFDQTRDALIQHLRPILLADDSDDAVEDISDTLESLGKQFRVRLEAAGVDVDTKSLAGLESGPLDAFLPAVESAVGAFVASHRARLGVRLKEGRVLSGSNVDRLRKMHRSLSGHVGDIADMLRQAGHEPGDDEPARPAVGNASTASPGKAAPADADAETKGVVPFKSGPVKEGAWDGTAADNRVRAWAGGPGKDAIDWGKYRSAFAYIDPGDGDGPPADFGAYHLLHHDVDGGALKVSRRGVFAAAVIIQGGRGGGADFVKHIGPQATAGVKAHLGKHYSDDLDMPAPWDRAKAGLYPEEIEATGVTEAELKTLGWAALPAPGGGETEPGAGAGTEAKSAPTSVPHSEVMQLFTRYIETIEAPRLGIASPAGR
jgi:HK97 family phage prohead protease